VNLDEILAIIERIGSDNPPSASELETAQTDMAREIRNEARGDSVDLAILTSLREGLIKINTAHSSALASQAAQAADIAAILADVPDPDASDAPDDPEDESEDAPEEPEEAPEVITPDEVLEPERVPVAAAATPARTLPLRDAVSRVRQRPVVPAPLEMNGTSGAQIFVSGAQVDRVPTIRETAQAFERAVRSPSTGKATLVRVDNVFADDQVLPGNTNGNTALLDRWIAPEAIAVAASGGCCSLPTPIREQNVLSSSARPVRDSLPTVGVTESGAVTYFPAICLPDAGAALWTCAEDESVDPDDDTTWKDCAVIDCPTAETTIVDAVYRCLTIGEFQRRFATEQWTGILQATMALQARIAEARLLARMLATVGDTLAGPATGSVFTNWAQGLQVIADSIRQDQRYIGVNIHQWIPSWLPGAIASDFYARRVLNIPDPTEVRMLMAGVARNAGVTITETPDLNDMTHATPAYPATATTVIAPEGYYSFLDGGQFDLGIEIRDLDLARQNAVAAFAESFEGLLARGCNAWRNDITITVCTDAAGCGSL
jgi:hypothetical protein